MKSAFFFGAAIVFGVANFASQIAFAGNREAYAPTEVMSTSLDNSDTWHEPEELASSDSSDMLHMEQHEEIHRNSAADTAPITSQLASLRKNASKKSWLSGLGRRLRGGAMMALLCSVGGGGQSGFAQARPLADTLIPQGDLPQWDHVGPSRHLNAVWDPPDLWPEGKNTFYLHFCMEGDAKSLSVDPKKPFEVIHSSGLIPTDNPDSEKHYQEIQAEIKNHNYEEMILKWGNDFWGPDANIHFKRASSIEQADALVYVNKGPKDNDDRFRDRWVRVSETKFLGNSDQKKSSQACGRQEIDEPNPEERNPMILRWLATTPQNLDEPSRYAALNDRRGITIHEMGYIFGLIDEQKKPFQPIPYTDDSRNVGVGIYGDEPDSADAMKDWNSNI